MRPAPLHGRAPLRWRPIAVCLALYFLAGAWVVAPGTVFGAENTYQSPDDFLKAAFQGIVPKPGVLWLGAIIRSEIKKIMGHAYPGARIRFWKQSQRTAWILEEVGKYKPITAGIIVNSGQIEQVRVLIYRESHGWEVRYPFFTRQFKDIRLNANRGLSRGIDGISGATLSVNALTRLATLALYLHTHAIDLQ